MDLSIIGVEKFDKNAIKEDWSLSNDRIAKSSCFLFFFHPIKPINYTRIDISPVATSKKKRRREQAIKHVLSRSNNNNE